jgi:hypothetical protein
MIPDPHPLDQHIVSQWHEADLVVQDYRAFFAHLDWSQLDDASLAPSTRGPHPKSAYVKAFLIAIREGHRHRTDLRAFLVRHPWLVLEIGFRPVTDTPDAAASPLWLRCTAHHSHGSLAAPPITAPR